jgi:S1-C subfamily serine protease
MIRWIVVAASLVLAGAAPAGPRDPIPPKDHPDTAEEAQTLDAPPRTRARVWLGVFIEDALDGGVQVVDVVPDGPAYDAGLVRGDVLIQANGAEVANLGDLRRVIVPLSPGDPLSVIALRDGTRRTASLVLASPPPPGWTVPKAPTASAPHAPFPPLLGNPDPAVLLGLGAEAIPSELRTHLGAPKDAGVLVTRVDPHGPCAARIKAGDVLVKANDRLLASGDDLARIALRGGTIRFDGVREAKPYTAEITVGAASIGEDSREQRIRVLEASIRQMEATIEAMRREIAALKSAP